MTNDEVMEIIEIACEHLGPVYSEFLRGCAFTEEGKGLRIHTPEDFGDDVMRKLSAALELAASIVTTRWTIN